MATTHPVQQGECLSSIAKRYGFADWRTIFDHPQNEELRKRRPNPNVLYPGDNITIPNRELKQESSATEKVHTFLLQSDPVRLRLRLQDSDEHTLDGVRYRLVLEGRTIDGKTGSNGLIEERIPADAHDAKLTIWLPDDKSSAGMAIRVCLGHLDPVEYLSGVQARLNNLGFQCGRVDGRDKPEVETALRAFQKREGLPVTGQMDSTTLDRLREKHDQL